MLYILLVSEGDLSLCSHCHHFAEKDRMVAARIFGHDARIDESQHARNNGRAGHGFGILGPTETLVAFQGGGGEAARKILLLNGQHVDGVSAAFSNVWQRLTVEINTYQDQRWIEGD